MAMSYCVSCKKRTFGKRKHLVLAPNRKNIIELSKCVLCKKTKSRFVSSRKVLTKNC